MESAMTKHKMEKIQKESSLDFISARFRPFVSNPLTLPIDSRLHAARNLRQPSKIQGNYSCSSAAAMETLE
jgi:hypothetical protein